MKHLLALFMLIAIALNLSCGGGSSSPIGTSTPVVHAATGFTNASLNGAYSFGISGSSVSGIAAGSGVATLDGAGNITGGDETININGASCHSTFTGTYSVSTNGTGTATITSFADAASIARGCAVSSTGPLSLAIGNSGNTLILAGQSAFSVTVATAVKQ